MSVNFDKFSIKLHPNKALQRGWTCCFWHSADQTKSMVSFIPVLHMKDGTDRLTPVPGWVLASIDYAPGDLEMIAHWGWLRSRQAALGRLSDRLKLVSNMQRG